MPPRQIYLLSPKELSPETIAVAFAKTSRSPESFREIAAELSDESSAQFHEKWVVGYGHASVAEHAVLHIAIENVSRLAVESIESNRLASYTEKSTRYQKWGREDFFIPPELDGHPLREGYIQTCRLLFDTYAQSLAPVRELIERQFPPRPNEIDEAYDRRIRSQYVDSCRFLLPAASLANLGMTANARVLENAIRKMRSHPLAEVRQVGEEIKRVAHSEVPTLVKYAEAVPYLIETGEDFKHKGHTCTCANAGKGHQEINNGSAIGYHKGDWCTLIDYDSDGETKVLTATLYRFGSMTFPQALQSVRSAPEPERVKLAESLLGRLSRYDIPLRELEHSSYTFELVLDQGAYAEFKRHRMMTQTPQALTAQLGYALPRRIAAAGLEVPYRSAMGAAAEMYEKLAAWNPHVAAYVVPNGFNRRVLFTMNLREAFAFCQLRAAANAHFSMRRVALRLAEEIRRVHPLLAKYLHLPEGETWRTIEEHYFAATKWLNDPGYEPRRNEAREGLL
jgi:thymidylate synthase ThyX